MAVPTSPSNRHLYETMTAWGWIPGKSKDGFIEMILLDHPGGMVKTTIAQPMHHKTTAAALVKLIVRATTGGDRDKFWNHPPTKKPPEKEPPAAVTEKSRPRGVSREVLTVLMQRGTPMTAVDLHHVLPKFSVTSIAGACSYLVSTGNAERLVRGMYKATLRNTPGQTVHHDVQGGVRHDQATAPEPRPSAPEPRPTVLGAVTTALDQLAATAPDRAPTVPGAVMRGEQHEPTPPKPREHRPLTEAQEDETLNTLLDLLFPTGLPSFQFLPAIEKWKNSTRKLMREVGR